jgi:integrase
MAKFYQTTHETRDGRILLYLNPKLKKPVWQARLRVDGIKGYIVKSTKHQNLAEATKVAENLYDDLRYKARNKLPIKELTFKEFFQKEWLPYAEAVLSIHRVKVHKSVGNRYLCGYFGNMKLSDIKETETDAFFTWRMAYWTSDVADRENVFYQVDKPSAATLRQEKGVLNQILKHAKRKGYLVAIPDVQVPREVKGQASVGRQTTYFDIADQKRLFDFMLIWERGGRHELHRFQRQMIRNLVMFLLNSGLRPGEAWQLRSRDILPVTDQDLVLRTKVYVRPTTKTGERFVMVNLPAERYLRYAKELLGLYSKPDHLIWANRSGDPMNQCHRTFESMLREAGLLYDSAGRKRTLYSCRHTFATNRLLNDVPINDLADNMGTDVRYIQKTYSHVTTEMRAKVLTQQLLPEYEDLWAEQNENHRRDREVRYWEDVRDIQKESGKISLEIEEAKKRNPPWDYAPVKGKVIESNHKGELSE